MALENGIAQLVAEFIAAGRPSSRKQNIDDRRKGYIASTALAGEKEIRVKSEDIVLEEMTFRVISPLNAASSPPVLSTFMAAVLSAVGLSPMIISCDN